MMNYFQVNGAEHLNHIVLYYIVLDNATEYYDQLSQTIYLKTYHITHDSFRIYSTESHPSNCRLP